MAMRTCENDPGLKSFCSSCILYMYSKLTLSRLGFGVLSSFIQWLGMQEKLFLMK